MFRDVAPADPISVAVLLSCGIVLLIVGAMLRRAPQRTNVVALPTGEDLLAQAEETALVSSVVRTIQERAKTEAADVGAALETTEASETQEEEIDWQEREDVYRPEIVDAVAYVRSLVVERAPEIVERQNQIFIRQSAYAQLREHLRQDVSVELGGLLYGQAFYDPGRTVYLLVIEAALAASEGIETAISFAYTPASWEALAPQLQQLDSSWTLIGSYHSHPGLGVFLSETDLRTQETIFMQDWQVALVVDPIADKVGFFVSIEGTPCLDWRILPDQ